MSGVIVRPATTDDIDEVERLEATCLGDDAWSRALLEPAVAGELPTVSVLVAAADDVVVGHAIASLAGDIIELQRIGVDVAARRGGIASRLLEEVVRVGREGGADRLLLEVRSDNTGALAFYAARGMSQIDRRPRYYRDGADAVVLRLPLRRGCGGSG